MRSMARRGAYAAFWEARRVEIAGCQAPTQPRPDRFTAHQGALLAPDHPVGGRSVQLARLGDHDVDPGDDRRALRRSPQRRSEPGPGFPRWVPLPTTALISVFHSTSRPGTPSRMSRRCDRSRRFAASATTPAGGARPTAHSFWKVSLSLATNSRTCPPRDADRPG